MKACLLLILFTICYWSVNAQIPGEPLSVQGPNAASLGQYGEVPVSLFTGLPGIEIPLYTVQEGNITVPLSLSYHASGFRPDVHPGWVGMGWNLSAGGAINRAVHDGPDEYNNANRGGPSGYYFSYGLLSPSNWADVSTIDGLARNSKPDHKDTEPDEFAFNFGEYSGKFYLSSEGKWKVKCNRPVTVAPYLATVNGQSSYFLDSAIPLPPNHNYIQAGASKTFAGFTITTENGTQYVFGGVTSAIEYQVDLFDQLNREWVAGTWNLTQIIHSDGHRVNFTYDRISGKYISQMYYNLSGMLSMRIRDQQGFFLIDPTPSSPCSSTNSIPSYYYSTAGKLISPVYLKTIATTLCTVTFGRAQSTELRYQEGTDLQSAYWGHSSGTSSEFLSYLMRGSPYLNYPDCMSRLQWQELTDIKITTNATAVRPAQPIKGFVFKYNNNPNERLTLLQINEQGSSLISSKPPYRFGYNKYHSLKGYLLDQIDHWGFYNANYIATGNSSPDLGSYYTHREPSQDSAVYLAGMLTRIIYPTGGITDFKYEQHRFSSQLTENRFAVPTATSTPTATGGVRIKKISSYSLDQPNQKLEKEYFYVAGYTPGASAYALDNLPSSGVLGGQARYTWDTFKARAYNQTTAVYSRSIFSAQSVLPASSNSAGSHIGYSTVVEKRSDGSYNQYTYTNFTAGNGDPGHLDESPLNQLQVTEFTDTNRILYAPYCSTEEERGKLLREEGFNSAGRLVRRKSIDYIAFNKNTEFVRSINQSNSQPCPSYSPAIFLEGASYKLYTYSYLPIRETETIYDPTGGNPVTTIRDKTYSSLGYRLVSSESSTDSKNQTVTTNYRYPFDISFPAGSSPAMPLGDQVASAIYAMTAQNMIGSPIETITTRNGLVIGATVQTYRRAGPTSTSILPFQYFSLEATQGLSQYTPTAYGSQAGSQLSIAGGSSQMQLKATFTQYDAAGNPLGLVRGGVTNTDYSVTGGTTSSYLWGYKNSLPVVKAENAAPNEVFHSNFEENLGWDAALAYDNEHPRTGLLSGAMTSANPGDQYHSFGTAPLTIALTAPKKFMFSGWVYSEGPTAQLWLFMYKAGETGYFTNVDYIAIEPTDLNKWVYLQKEIDVPADIVKLNFRLTNYYSGSKGGRTWFDDVRIHPAEAQMTTYTHQPGVGIKSVSDANNRPTQYEYDGLNRLGVVRDSDGNILKQLEYHYQR